MKSDFWFFVFLLMVIFLAHFLLKKFIAHNTKKANTYFGNFLVYHLAGEKFIVSVPAISQYLYFELKRLEQKFTGATGLKPVISNTDLFIKDVARNYIEWQSDRKVHRIFNRQLVTELIERNIVHRVDLSLKPEVDFINFATTYLKGYEVSNSDDSAKAFLQDKFEEMHISYLLICKGNRFYPNQREVSKIIKKIIAKYKTSPPA